ncbi:MAG TPA: cell envelope biogenesis protein OmpA, partial [Flavobacteriaceae bacterium]|nr:cell envelope biogenesis protein OmpA [Flavobacteriaceae bacterium]
MKHLNSILAAALFLFTVGVANAQDQNNPWAIEVGVNAVDFYPVGPAADGRGYHGIPTSELSQGSLFDEYFNQNDHWNILASASKVSVARYIGDGFTFGAVGTINK